MLKRFLTISFCSSLLFYSCSSIAITSDENPYYYYVMCKYAQINKDFKSAKVLCEKTKQLLPKTRQIYKDLIKISINQSDENQLENLIKEYLKNFKDAEDYNFIASIYISIRSYDKALSIIRQGLTKYPDNLDLKYKQVDIYLKNGKLSHAKMLLESLINQNQIKDKKRLGRIYYLLARIYLFEANTTKAIENLEKSIEINPYNKNSYIILNELYRQNFEFKKAEKLLTQAISYFPNDLDILNRLFQLYVDKNDYENAKKVINQIIKINPKEKDALLKKFLLYLKIGQTKQVIKELEEVVNKNPKDPVALYILGMAYESENQYEKAKQIYKKVLELDPDNEDVIDRLVFTYIKTKETDKAIDILNRFFKKNPKNYKLLMQIAEIYSQQNKLDKAIEYMKKAQEINPKDASIYFLLAIYYDKMDNWKETERNLKKALEIRPNYPDALNYLGYSYILRGININKGLELVEKALKKVPNSPAYLDSYAWGLFKKGKYEEALEYILKAYKKMPDDPILKYHYGRILEAIGEKSKAKQLYKQALEILEKMEEEPEKGIKAEIKERIKNLKW